MTVVNQPIKVAWIDNELFLEANPSLEQSVAMEEMGEVPEEKLSNDEMKLIIKTAGQWQDRLRWPASRKALKKRNGDPVAIARRPSLEVDENAEIVEHDDVSLDVVPPEEAEALIEGYEPPPEEREEETESAAEDIEEKSQKNIDAEEEQSALEEIYVAEDETRTVYDTEANPRRTLNP